MTAATFARRRALRLAPAAWVCASITLALVGLGSGFEADLWISWGRSLAFWPAGTPIDGSYWTLGIELAFYGAVTLALVSGGGARRIEALVVAIGLTSLAFWIGCTLAGPAGAALSIGRAVELLLLKHGCFFALGALIGFCQNGGVTPLRLLAIAAVAGGTTIEVTVHAIESANDTGLPRAIGTALVVFATAVALLAAATRAQGRLARWISPDQARAIGMITYPLYLLHQDAGAAITAMLVHRGLAPGAALCIAAAAMLLTAALVARTTEPALRRRLARLLNPHHGLAPDTRPTASLPAG